MTHVIIVTHVYIFFLIFIILRMASRRNTQVPEMYVKKRVKTFRGKVSLNPELPTLKTAMYWRPIAVGLVDIFFVPKSARPAEKGD